MAPTTADASGLAFIDHASLRCLSEAARSGGTQLRLVGVGPIFKRCLEIGGFAEISPNVELVA